MAKHPKEDLLPDSTLTPEDVDALMPNLSGDGWAKALGSKKVVQEKSGPATKGRRRDSKGAQPLDTSKR